MVCQHIQSEILIYLVPKVLEPNIYIYMCVCVCVCARARAKNEDNGPVLTWAHNLYVVWAMNFLLWVVPNAENQRSNLSSEFLYSHYYYSSIALSLLLLLVPLQPFNPLSSLSSHIYSLIISGEL